MGKERNRGHLFTAGLILGKHGPKAGVKTVVLCLLLNPIMVFYL